MYTKMKYGKELKTRILQKQSVEKIGEWTYCFYLDHIGDIDSDFEDLLLTLNKMELGTGFIFTYQKLSQIADDLIAGKNVKL